MENDIIIIGGGHNGLVTAFYLARAGVKVTVLEAREIVGGCCVTEELIPGYRFSTCANVLWALRPKVVQDMGLIKRGLVVDSRQFLRLMPGGRYLFSARNHNVAPGEGLVAIQKEISKFSAADAAAMPHWLEFLGRLTRIFGPWLLETPPRLNEIYARCTDPEDKKALDLVMTNSISQLADRFFESEIMRDIGVGADMGNSYDVGTGLLFALTIAMGSYSETGEPVANGFVRGGMGHITELMRQAAVEQGVTIRTGALVKKIVAEKGQVTGVELASGETLRSRLVVSNVDAKRTFLSLISSSDLDGKFLKRVRGLQTHGAAGMKFHAALSEMLDYRVDAGLSTEQLRSSTLIISSRSARQAAWQAAERGDLPDEPIIAGFMPSVYDPSLAPAGKYTWSAYVTWAPVRPRLGPWSEMKEEMGERIIRVMERHTTNFRKALIDYVLLTPEDLDKRNYLTDGNIHHVDATPSQLLWQRPLEELANYRTPLGGLYLCGASTHPWGEVCGAPGHNAAHVILSDLKKKPAK